LKLKNVIHNNKVFFGWITDIELALQIHMPLNSDEVHISKFEERMGVVFLLPKIPAPWHGKFIEGLQR